MAERKGYEGKIAEIDSKIQHICRESNLDVGTDAKAAKGRRTRMSGATIAERVVKVLKNNPDGLTQIAISEASGVSYASVVKWIKENPEAVKIVGERKSKKIFANI